MTTDKDTEALIERLQEGVMCVGMHDDNSTELFDIEDANDVMAQAASALAKLPAGPSVKLLEWEQNWPSDPNSLWVKIDAIDRSYTIDPESNVFRVTTSIFPSGEFGSTDLGLYPTIEAAKAAAQADYEQRILSALTAGEPAQVPSGWRFKIGDRVTKTKGSSWTGHIVGFYSTSLTPVGYAVESENEPGSVQIYPEAALTAAPTAGGGE